MPFLTPAAKEVYRVYGEEEFFACGDLLGLAAGDGSAQAPPTPPRRGSQRRHREASVAVAALAGVGALLHVLLVSARTPAPARHRRARNGAYAGTASPRPAGRDSTHELAWSGVPVRRLGGTPADRSSARRAVVSHVPSARRSSRSPLAERSSTRHAAVGANAPVTNQTPPPARMPASSAVAATASVEFGFER